MRFEWDPKKAQRNLREHGVSFETATEVFYDDRRIESEDFIDENGEQRYQVIGMTQGLVLLLVAFVDRSDENDVVIRLIHARKAVAYESDQYAAEG